MERITCCQHKNEDGSLSGCQGIGKIDNNGTEVFPKGYCQKHYIRDYNYGDANFVKRVYGEDRLNNPLYSLWHGMKVRCYNENSYAYKNYGGRGIKMSDEWFNDFNAFLRDMGEKPSLQHSVDRIDNNGNYCKENCRWATWHEQSANQRSNNKNVGVSFYKKTGTWVARLKVNESKYQKSFHTEQEAIEYRKYLEETYLQ